MKCKTCGKENPEVLTSQGAFCSIKCLKEHTVTCPKSGKGLMTDRKWEEIRVSFDDNWVHTLRRRNLEDPGDISLRLDTMKAIIEVGKTLERLLGEAEEADEQ